MTIAPFRMLRWQVLIGAGLALPARQAPAQAPDAGAYSPARHEVEERRGVMVRMRDGVRLSVDIYSPRGAEGKLPGILSITPYDNTGRRDDGRWYARRGYVVVAADSRGRYDSDGRFDPFDSRQKTDGYDLVEWMARQPWSNGKVGMIGGSYSGWTQWWTAVTAPPHLAAIAPMVAPPDQFENWPYQHGVLVGGWVVDWIAMMSGRTIQTVDTGGYAGWSSRRADLTRPPYADINARRGNATAAWVGQMYGRNRSTDSLWKAIAYQGQANWSRVTVPTLAMSGWFDANHPGTPMNYLGLKRHGATPAARRPTIVIGPWAHGINQRVVGGIDYGPDAVIDVRGYTARWFDRHLKGIDNGVERDPPVYVFVMGENRWHAEADWPLPQARPTRFYLSSVGPANSASGQGFLTTTPPSTAGADHYVYDPRDPTPDPFDPYPGHNGHIDGALDTRQSAARSDVLVYQTPPLDEPVEVIGPIEATLHAATSARDTDWFVRLVDVHPDGRALFLAEGAIRARNRDGVNEGRFNGARLGTIEPGKVYQYTIRFWRGTANLFQRGHRIRVEISSSWSPYYLPNLNSGADNLATVSWAEALVARQTIHHGPDHPSHILLPLVPARGRTP
ncbi:MAG: CocE/NonD family hydrolase [Gemmatimonadetes bacterium]|nr:CocE/NonD family hydrolase [Gemmatimonadota bacterium]